MIHEGGDLGVALALLEQAGIARPLGGDHAPGDINDALDERVPASLVLGLDMDYRLYVTNVGVVSGDHG